MCSSILLTVAWVGGPAGHLVLTMTLDRCVPHYTLVYTTLYFTVLYCTVQCTSLYCIVLYCIVQCTALSCTVLYCYCNVLHFLVCYVLYNLVTCSHYTRIKILGVVTLHSGNWRVINSLSTALHCTSMQYSAVNYSAVNYSAV